tara:strand:- start:40 stop:273 length:234 start_codon:yes stop_codon:yes gene_type:complete
MANCKGLKGAKLKACQAKASALVKKATEGSSITELKNASTFRNGNASVIERKMEAQKKGIKSIQQMALKLAAEKGNK